MSEKKSKSRRDIAIIGYHGRFPQAENPQQFWTNLSEGRNCIEEIPQERWQALAGGNAALGEPCSGKWGGFIKDVDKFDPLLFRISPKEAHALDPQQRLFLESVWSGLEDAGYGNHRQNPLRKIGLFVGAMWHEYSFYNHELGFMQNRYLGPGSQTWAIANRISFIMNFSGPSVAVDTACSSSALAVHLACQSLFAEECEMAIAGGVNLNLHPGKFDYMAHENMLAAEPVKCCFQPGAEGYLPAEGVGSLVLKPLDKALADKDHIYATIKGSLTNHNGAGMFFREPNAEAQAGLLRDIFKKMDIDPRTISYLEMSAFGSEMVDRTELKGLSRGFRHFTQARQFCALGSLKPNIGHPEAASGMAQIMKVLLQLQYGKLLPTRFYDPLPADLNLGKSPFYLQREFRDWQPLVLKVGGKRKIIPRRAGINSFGAGGTNVHLILEEYIPAGTSAIRTPATGIPRNGCLLVFSARVRTSLCDYLRAIKEYITDPARQSTLDLADMAYTLQTGREAMPERIAFIAHSIIDLAEKIDRYLKDPGGQSEIYSAKARTPHKKSMSAEWIKNASLPELAEQWVQGNAIDWQQRYQKKKRRRISLPTYAFCRQSYWLSRPNDTAALLQASTAVGLPVSPRDDGIKQKTRRYLKQLLAQELNVSPALLDETERMWNFGLDSLSIKRLNMRLEERLGKIPATLFFEYQTIGELADHLVKAYPDRINLCAAGQKERLVHFSDSGAAQVVAPFYQKFSGAPKAEELSAAIAIIGVSGRYPLAESLDAFWENLKSGRDCITEIPAERWDYRPWFDPDLNQSRKSYSKWGGFIADFDKFDPLFFRITPREAELMDPQERLFLQTAWEAIEDAGYTGKTLGPRPGLTSAPVGVFVGAMWSEYQLYGVSETLQGNWITPSSNLWSIPNRVSYCFNFSGPSIAVDTACSSSLTAIHLACESLRRKECETAIAGGVCLIQHPARYLYLSHRKFASRDGKCRSFGEGGDGYVPGEGVGAVILKPLAQAIADNDRIYGVVRASAVNHGGKVNGYTVPSPKAQADLISRTLKNAGINPRTITYIEAHGTGTSLGDPIEIAGLQQAFNLFTSDKQFCSIGSVKSNIGHLEPAAGIAGLTKVLLQIKHKQLAPSIHAEPLNPHILFEDSPFYVQQELGAWEQPELVTNGKKINYPRRAGISSFGAGGANAHIIIEEYIPGRDRTPIPITDRNPAVIPFSAKNEERLKEQTRRLLVKLEEGAYPDASLADIAYTLQVGREAMEERLVVIARSIKELSEKIKDFLEGQDSIENLYRGQVKRHKEDLTVLGSEEDIQKTVDACLSTKNYMKLAEFWVNGLSFDWNSLYGDLKPCRISLPTYPFARDRYWVPEIPITDDLATQSTDRVHGHSPAQQPVPEFSENRLGAVIAADQERRIDFNYERLLTASIGYLKELLAEVTKIPIAQLEADASFEQLGLDSIMIATLNQKIEQWTGKSDTTLFFQDKNIETLGAYLAATYPDAVSGLVRKTMVSASPGSQRFLSYPQGVVAGTSVGLDQSIQSITDSSVSQTNLATDIAVIGVAGRYPQAATLEEFWRNLHEGRDCIEEIPPERWSLDGFFESDRKKADKNGLSYSKWGGFLKDIDRFDPLFFNLSPREALLMDPQERLLLEVAWECLENAGYTRKSLEQYGQGNQIGVFVGASFNNYQLLLAEAAQRAHKKMYAATSQTFSIANRVSYFMNFRGPSLTVDTACSSSLYAVHLACESIQSGQSSLAMAGGVNLSLHPSKYITIAQQQFNASDGRCRAFGAGGDGYVPAEAVGAVLLKPLPDAIRDNDRIHGIIKGTAVSHGGKTNGYTVPNPEAQALTIAKALIRSRVNPRMISFIEAHGTGTALGDPIEIKGLTDAFRKYTQEKGFCAISSVKSNIGHAEAAAGIAQLTKVLLQFKHQLLVKNVMHGKELNPNIPFSETPFIVQQELGEWKRPVIEGREYPRTAGISSFGAGGANAHIVVEEYIPKQPEGKQTAVGYQSPAVVVLSAKDEERLREQAQRLLIAVSAQGLADADLVDLAYTLQVGREAMEDRLGVSVSSMRELQEKLQGFVEGRTGIEGLYYGQVKRHKETLGLFAADEDMAKTVAAWIDKKKYAKLLDLWVKGLNFDWNKLYEHKQPQRIALPTYPFARERYWVAEGQNETSRVTTSSTISAVIHPLLHQNTSDLSEQRFTSIFQGEEFFLADHVVQGRRILPGVAYLEMARAAVNKAGGLQDAQVGIRLQNVVWARPIVVNGPAVRIHIGLFPEEDGEIAYEIYSEPEGGNGEEPIVHSQGRAVLGPIGAGASLDLKGLAAEFGPSVFSAAQCYEAFKAMGIEYGPSHQGIEKVYLAGERILAKLSLPSSVSHTLDQYMLHPSMLDSALQSAMCFMIGPGGQNSPMAERPSLPFALEELEIFGPCTASMWALIRNSAGSKAVDAVQKLDIDLCDEQGQVRARMKGFSARMLEGEIQTTQMPKAVLPERTGDRPAEAVLLTPVWDLARIGKEGPIVSSATDRVLIVGGTPDERRVIKQVYSQAQVLEIQSEDRLEAIVKKLEAKAFVDHIFWIASYDRAATVADDILIEGQSRGVRQLFRMIKALLSLGYGTRALSWSIITIQTQAVRKNDFVNPTHASVHGLSGCLAKEFPNWKIRLMDLEADGAWPVAEISALPPDSQGNAWAYRERQWYREKLVAVQKPSLGPTLYKKGGVYAVIGGAGGIGEVWSEYMIRTYAARIIWIGRREKDDVIQAKLDRLASLGSAPLYIRADATSRKDLENAYAEIKKYHAKINGVIHAAIVLSDQSLMNMDEERFQAGLAAKVDVSVRMAQVFQKEPLDFVLFFSSLNSFTKAAGQSNYASGCTFKDALALRLAQEWSCAVKVINWGYWGNVGIVASKAYQERMNRLGIGSIEPPEAMEALEILLSGSLNQMAFLKTMKTFAMERMDLDEFVTINPTDLPAVIQNISKHISEDKSQAQLLKSESDQQEKDLNELLHQLLWVQLHSMGMFFDVNLTIDDMTVKSGLRNPYKQWLAESIGYLARNNHVNYDGKLCSVLDTKQLDAGVVWKEWDRKKIQWSQNPDMKNKIILLEKTLQALPEVLMGKIAATDILFPNSSMELVESIYANNRIADYFNQALADVIVACIKERLTADGAAKFRLLEIGAGSGGSSSVIFQKLKLYQEYIQEYCYSDISKAFLIYAEKKYGSAHPYLSYRLFDAETPIAEQNMHSGTYDIVIATNVLHATKNIRQTIRNIKALLKNGGLIFLNELNGHNLFIHLTFGLLDGWWLFEDSNLRLPGGPLLSSKAWQIILEGEGFQPIIFPYQSSHILGQQIIVAESDGKTRQKKRRPENIIPAEKKHIIHNEKISNAERKVSIGQAKEKTNDSLLREKSTAFFKKIVGEVLMIPSNKMDASVSFEEYGLDSILIVQLINSLREVFGNISNTLFFEFQTIDAIVEHFMQTQKNLLTQLVGLKDDEIYSEDHRLAPVYTSSKPLVKRARFLSPYHASKSKISDSQSLNNEAIAVIGLSGRYPKANNPDEFWDNLKAGLNCITEIPKERWNWREYFDEQKGKQGFMYTKWGGFLDDIDKFDPLFFQISNREARQMDPQERLFLEVVYNSLEDAGYRPNSFCASGKVGVFVGVVSGYYPAGSRYWSIANRISHVLNFNGPSMAVDTACSSSLTAIHLAVESLHKGTSECAIAGGVNLIVDPIHYIKLSEMTMLSGGNQCKAFGEQADGFVAGEGIGAIVLKSFKKAKMDNDHIYGIIKATAVNHGGKTNGYTVPNPNAQAEVIKRAIREAGIHSRAVSYIEAHGTGTSLGDPIEIAGLTKAFQEDTKDKRFCAIGSVKSNIGHTESAAGIAGVTKVLLQMKYGQIAPSLHSKILNPNIDFENTPFLVQQELAEWKRPVIAGCEVPRIAGISSFGAGGSNAHMVIEEYVPQKQRDFLVTDNQNPALVVLSAKNEERLRAQAGQLLQAIQERSGSDPDLADMAYTLQVGREAMEERLGVIADSLKELKEKLQGFIERRTDMDGLYYGQIKRNQETLGLLIADEDMAKAVEVWIVKKKYGKLLDLWVKGLNFDWDKLYGDKKPRRISLPTYQFARERCWVSEIGPKPAGSTVATDSLEILPASNVSALSTVRVESPQTKVRLRLKDHGSFLSNARDPSSSVSAAPKMITLEFLEEELQVSLAEALCIRQGDVEMDKKFIEMGMDSIIGVEWIQTINKHYGIALPAIRIYDYPTIREFAAFLEKELKKQNAERTMTPLKSADMTATDPLEISPASNVSALSTIGVESPRPTTRLRLKDHGPSLSAARDLSTSVPAAQKVITLESLQEELQTSLAEALFMRRSDVDADKKFIEMCMDSIIGVEWIQTINKQYGTTIAATKIYDYPTIREFAGFLEREMKAQNAGAVTKPLGPATSTALDDMLLQVYEGSLDSEQANQRFQEMIRR